MLFKGRLKQKDRYKHVLKEKEKLLIEKIIVMKYV